MARAQKDSAADLKQSALRSLKHKLKDQVSTDAEVCRLEGLDSARLVFQPSAVIFAKAPEDIGVVLRIANKHRVAVTVRGAGSSTTGAASPSNGGWALDLTQLNRIEVDKLSGMAHVQVGAVTEEINAEAEKAGWFYPPDPSSKKHSTIGGNIATNAGGLRGAKYGVTRDYVFGLEGFLPTGEFVRWGAPLRKYASGYNIRDLWIGSEGMLGVVTAATLKLIPKPEIRKTFLFGFSTERKALNAAQELIKKRLMPAVMEFMDRQTVSCALKRRADTGIAGNVLLDSVVSQFRRPPALLLIELDGTKVGVKAEAKALMEILDAKQTPCSKARNEREAEALWEVRRTCSQAMFQMGDTKLNEDVVVPVRSYHKLLDYTLELKKETGLATPTFGHAADGNFHVHLMFNHQDPKQRKNAERGVRLLMEKVVELGGAITGEHGIGLAKSPFMALQHSPEEIATMRKIKEVFDPNNILNPGKMFEPFEMWKHPRDYATRFPWDKKH
ncbi:FAD-binding oxidoreductase [Rubellicoccus peritrichatus]|uniref:FAD-linked oxidase C-terminal domain-containing protein n=1 Tax=Rubellicoccus peritrichatus TaxID=3080537 RepID=A0AAQ3LCW0_9BACT|nr:FAD-linked oxidase C-terminal domain-containing protein [Puniceicoccus sp. CR14]WOO39634.1 FAD-linked oxidase C-terminal domain-containing protein [Puniceicoccus sp. CR14]